MKYIFAVERVEQLLQYQNFVERYQQKIEAFLHILKSEYAVTDTPNSIVLTSAEIATKDISSIPVPAYTNDFRTVFCPDLLSWQKIYLKQLDPSDHPEIRDYYETRLNDNHILQILGHEFVHHSDFFPDGSCENGIWFEEGMCEYISRKYFLTNEQFQEESRINALLVELQQETCGQHPLEEFGAATYAENYASIFYEYWRSFLAVNQIVNHFEGNILRVLKLYQNWISQSNNMSLSQYFDMMM